PRHPPHVQPLIPCPTLFRSQLLVVDDVPAGGFPSRAIGPGEAARIMTGAPVPEGADTVVRVEHTDVWDAAARAGGGEGVQMRGGGRKSTRLKSSHVKISYDV